MVADSFFFNFRGSSDFLVKQKYFFRECKNKVGFKLLMAYFSRYLLINSRVYMKNDECKGIRKGAGLYEGGFPNMRKCAHS
jgi:hypothetical protein